MTDRECYHWLVERLLELELQISVMKGLEVRLPDIERKSLYDDPREALVFSEHTATAARNVTALAAPPDVQGSHRWNRRATPADIAEMRAQRARGLSFIQIGRKVRLSYSTARKYTADVLLEREANAT